VPVRAGAAAGGLSGGKETNKERRGNSPAPNPCPTGGLGTCSVWKIACPVSLGGSSPSDRGSSHGRCEAGDGPPSRRDPVFSELGCLGMQSKVGGKLHLRLNTGTRPIVDKYLQGKLKRTLKREFNRARNR